MASIELKLNEKSLHKKINYLTWRMHHEMTPKQEERWLKGVFYHLNGYMPNLRDPASFNEKMCWYRLRYKHPDIARICDKVSFKEYISEVMGDGYTAELYGYWDDEDDISFTKLPDRFVLKSSLSSAAEHIVIVDDKESLHIDSVRYQLSEWLQPWNSSNKSFSNWFKNVQPRILAEELLEPTDGDLRDYKFFCFNGVPKALLVVAERNTNQYKNFYDLNWQILPFERKFRNSPYEIKRPRYFDEMVDIAKSLSKPFPFVRVDFYETSNRLLVGELTFSPGGGLQPFTPREWDYEFGSYFTLPTSEG